MVGLILDGVRVLLAEEIRLRLHDGSAAISVSSSLAIVARCDSRILVHLLSCLVYNGMAE